MKIVLLLLLLLSTCQTSAHSRASLQVTPNQSQFFEYERLLLTCEDITSGEWKVWRYIPQGLELSSCGAGWGSHTHSACEIKTVKLSDCGIYWCQSTHGHSSNSVNISVTENTVMLQSPALPVTEGDNITLLCRTRNHSGLPANFYKDNSHLRHEPTGRLTIYQVSKSDEGHYKCDINNAGTSPSSWLLIKDNDDQRSLTPEPDSAQIHEYNTLTLNCGASSTSQGWKVNRFATFRKEISSCSKWGQNTPTGCTLDTVKQTDSAVYWCESQRKQRTNSVNITVYAVQDTPVILQSPVLPVMKGGDVTLHCKTKNKPNLPAAFYKDDSLIRTEPMGSMIIYNVTKSDEGIYKCNTSVGMSPSSWLFIIDPDVIASHFYTDMSVGITRYILVCFPYIVSTVLMVSIYCRPAGRSLPISTRTSPPSQEDEEPQYDDVIAEVTTEHSF